MRHIAIQFNWNNSILFNAMRCIKMQCSAMQCNSIQDNEMQFTSMQHNVMPFNANQWHSIQFKTILWNSMQIKVVQCRTTQLNDSMQFNTIQCNTAVPNTQMDSVLDSPTGDVAASFRTFLAYTLAIRVWKNTTFFTGGSVLCTEVVHRVPQECQILPSNDLRPLLAPKPKTVPHSVFPISWQRRHGINWEKFVTNCQNWTIFLGNNNDKRTPLDIELSRSFSSHSAVLHVRVPRICKNKAIGHNDVQSWQTTCRIVVRECRWNEGLVGAKQVWYHFLNKKPDLEMAHGHTHKRLFFCASACREQRSCVASGFNVRAAKFSDHGGSRVSCGTNL